MLRRHRRTGRRLLGVLLAPVLAATVMATGVVGLTAAPASASGTDGDGRTMQTAGASCWGIKQAYPASGDGVYWVVTPRLVTPRQVWCDQTSDGGGWVLVGRGREGWNWRDGGQGTQAAIATTPTGPAAFSPATYTSSIVDGLLNGQSPQSLSDGVRLRRSETMDGSSYQDIRWFMRWTPRWTWSFGAGIPVISANWTNGAAVADGTTYDNVQPGGANNGWARIWTWRWSGRASWAPGFAYGYFGPAASNSATSYLWQSTNGEGHAVPFAQVYVRPRIANGSAGFAPIPDAGTSASTLSPLMKNVAEPITWGVVGLDAAQAPATSAKATVTSLAQVGDRVFVGGIFTGVQQGAAGVPVPQRFLAAFDRATGAWISSFRPDLNGGVWSLAASGNRLIVGGRFSTVNGAVQAGLVALDPLTGAVDPTWKVTLTGSGGGLPAVRSLFVQNGWVYLGGSVTVVSGGTGTDVRNGVRGRSLFRVAASNGKPDFSWLPQLAGTPWWLSGSASRGDRIYMAGRITTLNGTTLPGGIGAVSTAAGAAVISGSETIRPSFVCQANCTWTGYGQAVTESADGRSVFTAPTEHILQKLSRDTFAQEQSALYGFKGGDVQAIAEVDGVVYSACHCFHWSYRNQWEEKFIYPQPGPWDRVSSVNGIGAYTAGDLEKIDDWEPAWKGAFDDGTWSFLTDSSKCLWTGGDVVRRGSAWAGGFLKFCPRDTEAPRPAAGLVVTKDATGAPALTWTGGSDAAGAGFRFEVLRDDRVVAVTGARTWTDTGRLVAGRYAVRTVDTAGNRSASTPVVSFIP